MSGLNFSGVAFISKSWNLLLSLFGTEIQKDGVQLEKKKKIITRCFIDDFSETGTTAVECYGRQAIT